MLTQDKVLILASQSTQRLNLLKSLPLTFQVRPAEIDEQAVPFTTPADKAEKIARAKAEKVLQDQPQAVVIAADTFCYCRGQILEKPASLAEAKAMLELQSGQELLALTGYAFAQFKQGKLQISSGCEVVKVKMRSLSQAEIEHYLQSQPVLTWSAAFSPAYDAGAALIAEITGNYSAFSHGLPIDKLSGYLRQEGFLL